MKYLAAIVVGLLVGFALGGWGLREDVRRLKQEMARVEKEQRRGDRTAASIAGVTRMLNVPESDETAAHRTPARREEVAEGGSTNTPELATNGAAAATAPERPDRGGGPRRTPEERLEEAVKLWELRSDLARNSFLTNTRANDQETLRFDVLLEAMNIRIETSIAEWSQQLRNEQISPSEAAVRMMRDISEAIALTYDEFDRTMPPDWRARAGEEFQFFDLIDPRVAAPLIGLEGRFDG